MKITEYTQVREMTVELLSKEVNAYIGKGFQPYGDPFMYDSHTDGLRWFVQAMVKYDMNESGMDDKYLYDLADLGWFFEDETGCIEGNGPYPTKDACRIGLLKYAADLNK